MSNVGHRSSRFKARPESGPAPARVLFPLLTAVIVATGCGGDSIQVYSVPKEKERTVASDRAPAGPAETAQWQKPSTWIERGAGRMSVASFSIAGEGERSAEVAIMPFTGDRASDLDFLNIWRGGLKLKPLDTQSLASITVPVRIAGQPASLYRVSSPIDSGEAEPSERVLVAVQRRPGATWLFKIQGDPSVVDGELDRFKAFIAEVSFKPSEERTVRTSGGSQPQPATRLPDWQVPSGWKQQSAPEMLLAKFVATGTSSASVDITVSAFPGPAGGLLMNVNRWRGQLALQPVATADLEGLTRTIEIHGKTAVLVEMSGTDAKSGKPARVIGAVVAHGAQTWFFKMMGDLQVSEEQKPEFMKFLQSLRFPDA